MRNATSRYLAGQTLRSVLEGGVIYHVYSSDQTDYYLSADHIGQIWGGVV